MTIIPPVFMNSVHYQEVSTIEHVHYREAPLYTQDPLDLQFWIHNQLTANIAH